MFPSPKEVLLVQTRSEIRFLLNDEPVVLSSVGSSDMLLDFLRIDRRLTGTKEGCAEGDCGACTVLVGRLRDGELRYKPLNACIRFLASMDGCHVVTVEHLRGSEGGLHPVQQAMVDHHGSQCGFCTPGFVVALYALWMENDAPTDRQIESALQGNLCRCTGYEPIIAAARAMGDMGSPANDWLTLERARITDQLAGWQDGSRVEIGAGDDRVLLPASVDDFAELLEANPDATIVAGATDVGLWVTKFLRPISPAIYIGHLDGLASVDVSNGTVRIGANVTYTDFETVVRAVFPHLHDLWDRIAGWQVRSMGTIGGNVANGSPIGDTPPVLIAMGATVELRHGSERRSLPLEEFFIDYGKQDRQAGEFVEAIAIPRQQESSFHAAYKISKRRDEDISSVCAAFNITVSDGVITEARIAFGGMAATPKRAAYAEMALVGQSWSEASLLAAGAVLDQDFEPLSDWRATAEYRLQVSRNLFRRFWLEKGAGAETVRLARAS